MATVADKLLTAEEFARLPNPPDGSKQELVQGIIVTRPAPGFRHGLVQGRICSLVDQYVRKNRLGRTALGCGLITERDPDTVRGPAISFWSFERLPPENTPQGYPEVAADLCGEIISPSNQLRQIQEKIREYSTCGVRLVWIVDPEDRTVRVYRSPEEGRILHETATLSGEDVLPGFSCKVADFFS